MSAELDRADAYATSDQLGQLFERTAAWLTLYGIRGGSPLQAYKATMDGTLIYTDTEPESLDAIENYEYDVTELTAQKLWELRGVGRVAVEVIAEYIPEHYVLAGPENGDYSRPTCRFTSVYKAPNIEEILHISRVSRVDYSSGRHTIGEESDGADMCFDFPAVSAQSFAESMELERSLELCRMTAGECRVYLGAISLLEQLK